MKLLRILVGLLIMLVLCMSVTTFAADEIVIDVVGNELQVQGYRVQLEDTDKPITVDLRNNEIILYVKSNVGEVELNLGEGTIALTQRAVAYVQLTPNAQGGSGPSASPHPRQLPYCIYCGADNANGSHYCPRCGLPYCQHDDIKCSYRLNPAPTPWTTMDPDGNKLTFYLSPDGTYYAGTPTKMAPIDGWKPAEEYGKEFLTTPSPTPTFLIGAGATATPKP